MSEATYKCKGGCGHSGIEGRMIEGYCYDCRIDFMVGIQSASLDMYKALKEFVDSFSEETGYSNPSYECVNNAINAIAKAEATL